MGRSQVRFLPEVPKWITALTICRMSVMWKPSFYASSSRSSSLCFTFDKTSLHAPEHDHPIFGWKGRIKIPEQNHPVFKVGYGRVPTAPHSGAKPPKTEKRILIISAFRSMATQKVCSWHKCQYIGSKTTKLQVPCLQTTLIWVR